MNPGSKRLGKKEKDGIKQKLREGYTDAEIRNMFGISQSTLYRIKHEIGKEKRHEKGKGDKEKKVDYGKIYTLFDEGKDALYLVKHNIVNPKEAMEIYEEYKAMKEKTREYNEMLEKIKSEAWNEGHSKGVIEEMEQSQIWYFCNACGQLIYMSPNSNAHKAMIRYMKENCWGHSHCH